MDILDAPLKVENDITFAQALGNVFEKQDIQQTCIDGLRFLPEQIEHVPYIGYVVLASAVDPDTRQEVTIAIPCGDLFEALDQGILIMVEPEGRDA